MNETPLFQNDVIAPESLPQIADIGFQKVEKSYLKVSVIASILLGAVLMTVGLGIVIFVDDAPSLVKMILPVFFLFIFIMTLLSSIKGYKYMGYAIRQRDIVFRKGWLWKSTTMIPFKRVQHCEVNQNPLERLFGLSRLKVFTAGGASSDLSIAGLTPHKAEQLKLFITTQTAYDEEE